MADSEPRPDPLIPADAAAQMNQVLRAWYRQVRRDLPWRMDQPDPYRIWVSEIMLQQTRVETVLRYYGHFLKSYPDVHALAVSGDDTLLLHWEGLGYYRRARNLRAAAQIVVREWLNEGGRWPRTSQEWRTLPGIGPYTAAAIASICFDEPAAVVDGNVKRVLTRMFAYELPANSAAGGRAIQAVADKLITADHPAEHNQALMELGATVCLPKNPRCRSCPWWSHCRAHREGRTREFPVLRKRKPVPHVVAVAALIRHPDGAILIRRRPPDGLLGGMWELPGLPVEEDLTAETVLINLLASLSVAEPPGEQVTQTRHTYSHFSLEVSAYLVNLTSASSSFSILNLPENLAWLTSDNRNQFALHRAHDKLIAQFQNRQDGLKPS